MQRWLNTCQFKDARKNLYEVVRITYGAKPKLHGTNAGIRITPGKPIICQSRNGIVAPGSDNAGFAGWATQWPWNDLVEKEEFIIFGEWAGPGIQKKPFCSVFNIPKKTFFVFAIYYPQDDMCIIEPDTIKAILGKAMKNIQNLEVLPWVIDSLTLNIEDADSIATFVESVNRKVIEVEKEDPYIKDTFNISGPGEGIVLFPRTTGLDDFPFMDGIEELSKFIFKAKCEDHRVNAAPKAVTINAEVFKGVQAFCNSYATVPRFQQGIQEVFNGRDFSAKDTKLFIDWVMADIYKESTADLEASGLTWKDIQTQLPRTISNWYSTHCKGLQLPLES